MPRRRNNTPGATPAINAPITPNPPKSPFIPPIAIPELPPPLALLQPPVPTTSSQPTTAPNTWADPQLLSWISRPTTPYQLEPELLSWISQPTTPYQLEPELLSWISQPTTPYQLEPELLSWIFQPTTPFQSEPEPEPAPPVPKTCASLAGANAKRWDLSQPPARTTPSQRAPVLAPAAPKAQAKITHACSVQACNREFARRQELKRHFQSKHVAPRLCMHCGVFQWHRPYLLWKHLEKEHPDVDFITEIRAPATPTGRPSTTRHRRHHGSTDEPDCSSSLEFSSTPRLCSMSHIMPTPLAQAPPLEGVLKTGEGADPKDMKCYSSKSSTVSQPLLIEQDRDGYASSSEKGTSLRPSSASHGRILESNPPHVVDTTTNPSRGFHWRQSAPRPPEGLHPTLVSWLKNMNKLSDLIDRLHELASAAPSDYKPQLERQVAALRATFKRQQERCVQFLQLSEEYANRYLLDISAEIQQQSSFLDMLEKRLDMAKILRSQAVDLRRSYELGTVDAMKRVRETEPLPEDLDLFSEVDFVLDEIRRCFMELDQFWTEEIHRAIKALNTCRMDPDDVERWRGFKASLEQTIESWKTKQGGDIWSISQGHPPSPSAVDLGAIASSLSPTLSTLKEALQRVQESASLESSHMRLSFVLRANLESTQNNLLCFDFFRRCVDFGDIILAFSDTFIGYPTLSRVRGSNELQERAMALATEAADVLAEGSTQSQGSRKFNSLYKQSLALLWKMTLGLNTLLESASSWMIVTDALPDAPAGGISLGLLREQSCAWAKGRASIRMGLAALTNDPVERLRYHCLSLSSPRPRSLMTRRMMRLVCFA